jgi:hypothetical protein
VKFEEGGRGGGDRGVWGIGVGVLGLILGASDCFITNHLTSQLGHFIIKTTIAFTKK